jgi:tyrosinase
MLEKYARAVGKMMDRTQVPEGHPSSWLFQWYTHAVDGSRSMTDEIARVYANAGPNDPNRLLAAAMWNTCQAHGMNGLPQDYRMFMPWHRMYVYYFERIIRNVLSDNTFTLPYWDYTSPGKRAIPEQFRRANDPVFKSLFRGNRNDGMTGRANVNAGEPIDKGQTGNPLNLEALAQAEYERRGVVQGFCSLLDGRLHGSVHVLVGQGTNMGSILWAARDPIFWLHHCNIDRLWASWNKAGRANPAGGWLTQSFVFADENGAQVDALVRDFVDTETIPGGAYQYDKLEPVPPIAPVPLAASAGLVVATQAQPGAIRLNPSAPVRVALAPAVVPLSSPIGRGRRTFLVLRNLEASAPPEVLYDVYVDPPSGAPSSSPAGTINFFDAVSHSADHGAMSATDRLFSFDVTEMAARFNADGQTGAPNVRIVPSGIAPGNANPVVGSISLIQQ